MICDRCGLEHEQTFPDVELNPGAAVCIRDLRAEVERLRQALNEVLAKFPPADIIESLEPLDAGPTWQGRPYPSEPVRAKQIAAWRALAADAKSGGAA